MATTNPSMVDRPFGCPPDKPRCSCGSKLKTVGTVDGERKCGSCFGKIMRQTRKTVDGELFNKYNPPNKFGAVRTEVDGITFASKGEARRYGELKQLEKAGYIRKLELQPVYPIHVHGSFVCNVVMDFRYFEGQTRQVEDFKGKDNPLSRLKRKLVEAAYPGTKVKVVR